MKKKSGGEGGGANWMDTYGDMVTLLLCFFVLLYSMSTVDEEKWKQVAMSFNPNALSTPTDPGLGTSSGPFQEENENNPGVADPSELEEAMKEKEKEQETIDDTIEKLYQQMKAYLDQTDAGKNVEITKGDGGIYLSFADAVFFSGDSYELLDAGKELLLAIAPMLDEAGGSIDEIRILGHTAQARDWENDVIFDRMLSSERAAQVTAFLQQNCQIDPGRLVSQGYGQHRPVAVNDDENRWKNRRVEMIITGKDLMDKLGDALEQYSTLREDGPTKASDAYATPEPEEGSGSSESGSGGSDGTGGEGNSQSSAESSGGSQEG